MLATAADELSSATNRGRPIRPSRHRNRSRRTGHPHPRLHRRHTAQLHHHTAQRQAGRTPQTPPAPGTLPQEAAPPGTRPRGPSSRHSPARWKHSAPAPRHQPAPRHSHPPQSRRSRHLPKSVPTRAHPPADAATHQQQGPHYLQKDCVKPRAARTRPHARSPECSTPSAVATKKEAIVACRCPREALRIKTRAQRRRQEGVSRRLTNFNELRKPRPANRPAHRNKKGGSRSHRPPSTRWNRLEDQAKRQSESCADLVSVVASWQRSRVPKPR